MMNYWYFAWLTLAHMNPRENHLWKYICELKPENQLFVEFINDLISSICSDPCVCTPQMFEIVGVWSFDQYISQFTWNIGYNNNNYSNPQSILLDNKFLLPITIFVIWKILHCPMNPTMYWNNMQYWNSSLLI